MTNNLTTRARRIESIDIVRGIAMVIMALDHVRDYFHQPANIDDPLNLATTTPWLYATRWITHLCAPIFVFLSGTSIYLQSQRKTPKELGMFLVKRGLWLILAEWTIIALAWTFNPMFNVVPFQVIWAIGISMFLMGIMILLRFPFKLILVLGILIVAGHNLLDIPESRPGFEASFWWNLFHHGFFVPYQYAPDHYIMMVYPFVAWTGLMMLGYCLGTLFTPTVAPEKRQKILLWSGLGLLAFFAVLRYTNVYGDPYPWSQQKNFLYTLLSFMKVHKYPPSLLYLSATMGIAFLGLAFFENIRNRFTGWMRIYGRTAFFYYILHLYLVHLLAAVSFFIQGKHSVKEAVESMRQLPFLFLIPGEGYRLPMVYLIWIFVVIVLYPLCKKYDAYKTAHKEKWWLSYL
ncbi:MAG: DUF1624 domain-containing protein [Chitinophagaceae bacterium]